MNNLLLILFSNLFFAQNITGTYEFEYKENRTPTSWDKIDVKGKVIFLENNYKTSVIILTNEKFEYLYVKSIELFIKKDNFLYTLINEDYEKCFFKIVINTTSNTIDLYYYSDRIEEKYYKLKLHKCE